MTAATSPPRRRPTRQAGGGGTGERLLGTPKTRHGFLLGLGSGRLPDTLRGALWYPGGHVVTDGDDHRPRDFVELLDQPDGGRRIRDDDMEQVGVYVLAALLAAAASPGAAPFRAGRTTPTRVDNRREAARATKVVFKVDPVRWSSAPTC